VRRRRKRRSRRTGEKKKEKRRGSEDAFGGRGEYSAILPENIKHKKINK
jgi:hypothetical protein